MNPTEACEGCGAQTDVLIDNDVEGMLLCVACYSTSPPADAPEEDMPFWDQISGFYE